jgi:hypothetical protein
VEENTGESSETLVWAMIFLAKTPKTSATKAKTDKWNSIKL